MPAVLDQGNATATGALQRGSGSPTHPMYQDRVADWVLMKDTYAGERAVKEMQFTYLPPTAGMRQDGLGVSQDGWLDYQAYLTRAIYHEVVRDAVQAMVGVMHRKPAVVEVPPKLEAMLGRATSDGEDVQALLRRVNEQQLTYGRIGLLVEAPDGAPVNEAIPFVATYVATSVMNWDAGVNEQGARRLEMVALDESEWERDGKFKYDWVVKTRLLLAGLAVLTGEAGETAAAEYVAAQLRGNGAEPTAADFKTPAIGGRPMDHVPFTFVNANDLAPEPEAPPLLGLARLALSLYRGEADYQQNLFMQGQDTLVLTGAGDGGGAVRTGAGSVIRMGAADADAKYIGVSAAGLDAQAKNIDRLTKMCSDRGSKLLDMDEGGVASGEALKTRVAARTTTLMSVARTGAEGLRTALRDAAIWVGADPEEVVVEPNTDFVDVQLTGRDLLDFMSAKNAGAPISRRTIHSLMLAKEVTRMTFDEEEHEIGEEEPTGLADPTATGRGQPGAPGEDPEDAPAGGDVAQGGD